VASVGVSTRATPIIAAIAERLIMCMVLSL
jgi:hypothetical protein